jgi:hypothetical protein
MGDGRIKDGERNLKLLRIRRGKAWKGARGGESRGGRASALLGGCCWAVLKGWRSLQCDSGAFLGPSLVVRASKSRTGG